MAFRGIMIVQCQVCPREFVLTDDEIKFYRNKGWDLPKRCKECRHQKRQVRAEMVRLKNFVRKESINDSKLVEKMKKVLE